MTIAVSWETVAVLARGDAERLLHFVSVADELAGEEPFTPETLVELGHLVPADWVGYDEKDGVRERGLAVVLRSGDDYSGWDEHVLDVVASGDYEEDPLCVRHARGDTGALKLSDLFTPRELHATLTYRTWMRPWGMEHEMQAVIPSPLWHLKTFYFTRRGGDFSERDRAVLDLLQPHLGRIWRTAQTRRALSAALAGLAHESAGGARGVVLLGAEPAVEHVSPSARRLLGEFFGGSGERLPPQVCDWLVEPDEPLVVRRGDRSLRVERAGDALLLGEVWAAAGLTGREEEVLSWVARGKTNAQVAEVLWIAPGTVRKHLENAYVKLGVRTRSAAAARFLGVLDERASAVQPAEASQLS